MDRETTSGYRAEEEKREVELARVYKQIKKSVKRKLSKSSDLGGG